MKYKKEINIMVTIKCPHCEKTFELGKDAYNSLLNEIESQELDKKVKEKVDLIKRQLEAEYQLAANNAQNEQDDKIQQLEADNKLLKERLNSVDKDIELAVNKATEELKGQLNAKDNDIAILNGSIKNAEKEKESAISLALSEKEKEIIQLKNDISALESNIENTKKENESAVSLAIASVKSEHESKIQQLEADNKLLKEKLNNVDNVVELAVNKATQELQEKITQKDNDIVNLKGDIQEAEQKAKEDKEAIEKNYKFQLDAKEEEIKRWKEFRVGDSTKDIGESLEKYCKDAFEEVRADAYPYAYFEKDNKAIKEEDEEKGTKGDFIFRDYPSEEKDIELVSIMFEMKNEKDDGKTTNESHFKKLDADRTKKGCEYAVLVSTLESDSKLYNKGIVDVSHKYPKMFVVRPQFFLAIIGLIRNMALKAYQYKKQVVVYERENVDVTNFEKAVQAVADKISDDYAKSTSHYDDAAKYIDEVIEKLKKMKEEYRLAAKWLGTAQNRLPELEVRKLVKNNPTMKEKFDALEQNKDND